MNYIKHWGEYNQPYLIEMMLLIWQQEMHYQHNKQMFIYRMKCSWDHVIISSIQSCVSQRSEPSPCPCLWTTKPFQGPPSYPVMILSSVTNLQTGVFVPVCLKQVDLCTVFNWIFVRKDKKNDYICFTQCQSLLQLRVCRCYKVIFTGIYINPVLPP